MHNIELEDSLLVSSPGVGGLIYLEGKNQVVLSTQAVTGIYSSSEELILAPQADGGRFVIQAKAGSAKKTALSSRPMDTHDALKVEDSIYIGVTQTNEIIRFDSNFNQKESWRLPGEEDSSHLNSITIYRGRLIASIFGNFTQYRQYKEGTEGLGRIYDVRTGETLVAGLSQPHSLTVVDDLLYFCNSQQKQLVIYDGERVISTTILPGYARGLAVGDRYIYVGISLSRNIDTELHELTSGAISILDRNTMECIGIKLLPFREVYDIRIITRHADLLGVMAMQEKQNIDLDQLIIASDEKISALTQELVLHKARNQELEQAVIAGNKQIETMKKISSWRFKITGPLRQVGQYIKKR